jgi:DNA-binding NarL/FixJ family response regulator
VSDGLNFAEQRTRKRPVILLVEPQVLMRSCLARVIQREFTRFEVMEKASPNDLAGISGADVRLVALALDDMACSGPWAQLDTISNVFPKAQLAVFSSRDDHASAFSILQRGVRGFFPTSITIDVALAGLRLVLAGGTYCPPIITADRNRDGLHDVAELQNQADLSIEQTTTTVHRPQMGSIAHNLTQREESVVEELQLGRPNKVIAVNLGLSENTVKMHVQHIMRKLGARTRTEAVFIWNGRLSEAATYSNPAFLART